VEAGVAADRARHADLSSLPELGVGIGFRRALAADVFHHRDAIDFVEIISEHYLDPTREERLELARLAAAFPLIPHGLNLSIGTAAPADAHYLQSVAKLATTVGAPWWSDHLAMTRAGDVEIGHLAPVALTHASLDVVCDNIARAQAAVPVPFVVEHIASPLALPGADMSEAQFISRMLERTGAGLLLDLMNVYANAWNHGFDPYEFLESIPLDRVVYVHVIGGRLEDGIMIDSHTDPTPDAVWELLTFVAARVRLRGVLIEWDDHFPDFGVVLEELARARGALGRAAGAVRP
jgi:uncharacterized protein (UPF0276 family)